LAVSNFLRTFAAYFDTHAYNKRTQQKTKQKKRSDALFFVLFFAFYVSFMIKNTKK